MRRFGVFAVLVIMSAPDISAALPDISRKQGACAFQTAALVGGSAFVSALTGAIGNVVSSPDTASAVYDACMSADPCAADPNDPNCKPEEGAGNENAGSAGPPPPPRCLIQARQLASECGAQFQNANALCDGSRLDGTKRKAERTSKSLQGQENTKATCQETGRFQQEYANDLSQFASSCQQGVNLCAAACGRLQSVAAGCPSEEARKLAARYASQSENCQGGELAAKPGLAKQESDQARAQQASAENCESQSQASSKQAGSGSEGPLSQKSMETAGGNLSAPTADVTGQTPPSSFSSVVSPEREDGNPARQSESGEGLAAFGKSGAAESASSWGQDGSSSLAALPTRQDQASEAGDEAGSLERTVNADAPSGAYGGSGGRRPLLRRLSSLSAAAADGENPEGKAKAAGEEVPDLNQFRPVMTGMGSKCPPGSFPNPKNKSECFHSGHKNIFEVMKEAFNRKRHTPGELFNEE